MDMQKMKSGLTILAITVPVSILSLAAAAQDRNAAETDSPFIQHFDQDGNGIVSEDEFPGNAEQLERMDSNADGYLDATETPKKSFHGIPRAKDMLTDFDADGDGQISSSEFPGPAEHFDNMDIDGDGYITKEENESQFHGKRPPSFSDVENNRE